MDERQGMKICCPEEIDLQMGYISSCELEEIENRWPRAVMVNACLMCWQTHGAENEDLFTYVYSF
jgi:hypothetical protein